MSRAALRLLLLALAALLCPTDAALAQGDTLAIRAGRILPVSPDLPWVIENGVILIRDGRIVAVGADVKVPPDARIIDLPDATVMPGLVAASSGIAGQHAGRESIGAGYRAADAFDRYADYRATLAGGVTTVHVSPGWHRLLSGQGAVVKLAGPPDDRVLVAASDLSITLGPGVFGPPSLVEPLVPPSSDQAITPAQPQRPSSRLGQFTALKEAIEPARAAPSGTHLKIHEAALRQAWQANLPLRVQAQDSADITGAIAFLSTHHKHGYLVGGLEAALVAEQVVKSGLPLVYTIQGPLRSPGASLGPDPDLTDPAMTNLRGLSEVRLALALAPDKPVADLRLAAATALRAGLSSQRIIEAITRIPAEILGVEKRIGSLAPGRDADLLVLTGDPLATTTHVQRVYVGGRMVFNEAQTLPLVVRAGTIWLGPDNWLRDGSVLIENGKIVAVGKRVPVPPAARVIDAGPEAFVTPGLIDAHGHLGLAGDASAPAPEITLARLVGVPDLPELRVARAGVTTILLSPYEPAGSGSQVSAVKTAGNARAERVVSPTAAVFFDVRSADPSAVADRLKPRLEAAKKYLESWQNYEKALAEWKTKKAEGKLEAAPAKPVEEAGPPPPEDPLTGTWSGKIFGGPVPAGQEPQGKVSIKLTGNAFEGRIVEPEVPVDAKIVGTLDGKHITGRIEVDTHGLGYPAIDGQLAADDLASGTISFQGLVVNFEMRRTDKGAVEFKVAARKRRTVGKEGQPLPPKTDESLEPLRAVLEKKIPIVLDAATPAQIDAALDLLIDQYHIAVVLLNAEAARDHAQRLADKGVGVVLPASILRREEKGWYLQADDLARRGIPIAFQSNAEDGARTLPQVGLFAVERGLSAEAALAAMTIDPARMYKIDSRVGSIVAGKDGDLVIFSGHPFDAGSAVRRVIVNGQEVQR